MAALTADRVTFEQPGKILSVPVAASEVIYKGALVCADSNGRAVAAADTAGYSRVLGVALEQADNSSGAAEAINVAVKYATMVKLPATSITQAMVGTAMYVVDDQTFDDAAGATNEIFAGFLAAFESTTEGWLYLPGPADTADLSVGSNDIVASAVTEAKIADGAVTGAKLSPAARRARIP